MSHVQGETIIKTDQLLADIITSQSTNLTLRAPTSGKIVVESGSQIDFNGATILNFDASTGGLTNTTVEADDNAILSIIGDQDNDATGISQLRFQYQDPAVTKATLTYDVPTDDLILQTESGVPFLLKTGGNNLRLTVSAAGAFDFNASNLTNIGNLSANVLQIAGTSVVSAGRVLQNIVSGTIGSITFTGTTIGTSAGNLVLTPAGVGKVEVTKNLDLTGTAALLVDGTTVIDASGNFVIGQLDVDNLRLNGNTFSSTSGDIIIQPNGASKVDIQKNLDITAGSTLAIGGTVTIDSSRNISGTSLNIGSGAATLSSTIFALTTADSSVRFTNGGGELYGFLSKANPTYTLRAVLNDPSGAMEFGYYAGNTVADINWNWILSVRAKDGYTLSKGNFRMDTGSALRFLNSASAVHQITHSAGTTRMVTQDNTSGQYQIGYYTLDNPGGTWNAGFTVNPKQVSVTLGTGMELYVGGLKTADASGNLLTNLIDAGNLRLTANTLSVQNANGDLNLSANGTGKIATTFPINLTGSSVIQRAGADFLDSSGNVVMRDKRICLRSAMSHCLYYSNPFGGRVNDGPVLTGFAAGCLGVSNPSDTVVAQWSLNAFDIVGDLYIDGTIVLSKTRAITNLIQLNVDNIQLDGNTISTTNIDGNLNLIPNGNGQVSVQKSLRLSGGADFWVGGVQIINASGVIQSSSISGVSISGTTISTVTSGQDLNLSANGASTKINADKPINLTGTATFQHTGVTVISAARAGTFTQMDVDNLRIDVNTISSTNANGNIIFAPNGTGKVTTAANIDITGTGALQIDGTNVINADATFQPFSVGTLTVGSGSLTSNLVNTDIVLTGTGTAKINPQIPVNITGGSGLEIAGTTVISSTRAGTFAAATVTSSTALPLLTVSRTGLAVAQTTFEKAVEVLYAGVGGVRNAQAFRIYAKSDGASLSAETMDVRFITTYNEGITGSAEISQFDLTQSCICINNQLQLNYGVAGRLPYLDANKRFQTSNFSIVGDAIVNGNPFTLKCENDGGSVSIYAQNGAFTITKPSLILSGNSGNIDGFTAAIKVTTNNFLMKTQDNVLRMLVGDSGIRMFDKIRPPITEVTSASHVLASTEVHIVYKGAGGTLTLPASPDDTRLITIINVPGNALTVNGNGKTINGNATLAMSTAFSSYTLGYNAAGNNWNIVATSAGATNPFDQSLNMADSATFASLTINGNIAVTGTVDGVDIAALKTDVDGFPDALKNLTTAEIGQVENIGATTISATQWGYLGALDQGLTTSSNVTFNQLVAGNISASANLITSTSGNVTLRAAGTANGAIIEGDSSGGPRIQVYGSTHATLADDIYVDANSIFLRNNDGTTIFMAMDAVNGVLFNQTLQAFVTNAALNIRGNGTGNVNIAANGLAVGGTRIVDSSRNLENIVNITLSGTVDGVDVAALKTDVDGFQDALKNLTAAEILQLENINTTTISAAQWGYLGAMDQGVATTDSPAFTALTVNGNITVTGTVDGVDIAALKTDVDGFPDALKNLVTAEINQLENIGATTISATQWGYLGAKDQGGATTDSVTYAGVNVNGTLTYKHALVSGGGIYSATTADRVLRVDSTAGLTTIDLYAATGNSGKTLVVKRIAGANNVVVDATGAETIDGSGTYTLSAINDAVTIMSDGSNWLIIAIA